MELKTIHQTVEKCKMLDPDTAVNEMMLYEMVRNRMISVVMHGNRTVIDFETFRHELCQMLGLYREIAFPHLRSIPAAAEELKSWDPAPGINIRHIRGYLETETLHSIPIDNRNYVAMESFKYPYSQELTKQNLPATEKSQFIPHNSDYQIEQILKNNPAPVRKRYDRDER